jgi:hypothetical protein
VGTCKYRENVICTYLITYGVAYNWKGGELLFEDFRSSVRKFFFLP